MTMKTTRPNQDAPAKKRYEAPRLEVYGDIRVVTESAGHTSDVRDNGGHGGKTA